MMDEKTTSDYVAAALALQHITLDDERRVAVEVQFRLLETMAEKFLAEAIPPDIEAGAIFRL